MGEGVGAEEVAIHGWLLGGYFHLNCVRERVGR